MWFLDYYTGFYNLLFTDLYRLYMFMCTYALNTIFYACFSIQIYRYTCINLILDVLSFLWFSFMLLVIACTCMPEPHHIIWSCTCVTAWACNWLSLTYSLGYFLTTLNLHVQIQEPGLWWPCCNWSECVAKTWISGCLSGPSFFLAPWSAREILILLLVSTF